MHSNCNHLSAYKQFHCTDTALLKVHNEIALNMDREKVTALTLLDLSAVFDKIDLFMYIASLIGMAYQAQPLPVSAHS